MSRRRNNCLLNEVSAQVNIDKDINYKKFGFFWQYPWHDRKGQEVPYEMVEIYYRQLKSYDKQRAEEFRKINEDDNKSIKVPYRLIRETQKNHKNTKNLVDQFRKKSKAPIYFSFIDSDVINFNVIYTAYDQIVQQSKKLPVIMTTGYEFPKALEKCDADKLSIEKRKMVPALHFASQLDRVIRAATAIKIPLGVYYPEPNFCVLYRPNKSGTLEETFLGNDRTQHKLESVMLITSILATRGRDITCIFSDKNPIIIAIPNRAFKYKGQKNTIALTRKLIDAGTDFTQMEGSDLRRLTRVIQSHADNLAWAQNLNLHGIFEIKGKQTDFNSIVSRAFADDNPLYTLKEANEKGNSQYTYNIKTIKRDLINRIFNKKDRVSDFDIIADIKEAIPYVREAIIIFLIRNLINDYELVSGIIDKLYEGKKLSKEDLFKGLNEQEQEFIRDEIINELVDELIKIRFSNNLLVSINEILEDKKQNEYLEKLHALDQLVIEELAKQEIQPELSDILRLLKEDINKLNEFIKERNFIQLLTLEMKYTNIEDLISLYEKIKHIIDVDFASILNLVKFVNDIDEIDCPLEEIIELLEDNILMEVINQMNREYINWNPEYYNEIKEACEDIKQKVDRYNRKQEKDWVGGEINYISFDEEWNMYCNAVDKAIDNEHGGDCSRNNSDSENNEEYEEQSSSRSQESASDIDCSDEISSDLEESPVIQRRAIGLHIQAIISRDKNEGRGR